MIEVSEAGIMCTGKGVDLFRLIALKSALRLELHGIKMSRRMSALKAAKMITGLKSRDRKVKEEP